jgi:small-conductance mechanosensitive channel
MSISLGDVAGFAATVIGAFAIARVVRAVLLDDVAPRLPFRRGVGGALSTTAYYLILLGGFFLALGAAGVDFNRFSLLAGAFGVGIGFGLQNVVNNFVSGLILLYERPIQLRDVVELGPLEGEVTRIGIRSSTVRTFDGAEVIVPNGNLISEQLVNWTLTDQKRRVKVPVGVAYGTDHRRVIEVLSEAVKRADYVLSEPQPLFLFRGFGESSLAFEVRFWTLMDHVLAAQSSVVGAIYEALAEARIEIPFPQRELHLRTAPSPAAPRPGEAGR